ncbi:hypothetical protein [Streptomyces liliifuscus]|uniref:Uncharacterized protein n=1 Tax=Streptomyces liliifuscus TaxID=2797636 RepID=A0A7T7KXX9_9ACTN|nr:hypothetical protein [Streptomyces liliifuscus]QQM42708.1 hypothetical protein JEQ17_26970 [Streptomyces liliifuscus]
MRTAMDYWQPDPGETLLARTPVTFASGAAMRVRGKRWFRDTERKDIQSELSKLSSWPEGPVHKVRSSGGALGLNVLRGGAITVGVAIMAVLSSMGGNIGGGIRGGGSGTTHDRADEVEDFPVMWAAPGTVARTLPWQLDPGRCRQKHYRTHAILTDRRLLIVGLPFAEKHREIVKDEVLWETPRSSIGTFERRDFKDGDDMKVVFTDGSWCRLTSLWREGLTRYTADHPDLVPLDSLTPAQRSTAEAFAAAHAPDAGPPLVTRNPCGCYQVAALAPSTADGFSGISDHSIVMDTDGAEVDFMKRHWEDFSPESQDELRRLHHRPPSGVLSPK